MNSTASYFRPSSWERIFPEKSRRVIPKEADVFSAGDILETVFLVERGAVVEIRTDEFGASHAVGLSGPGTLLGGRLTSSSFARHTTRATALVESTLREISRSDFLHALIQDPELSDAFMKQLSQRLETAQALSATCESATSCEHVLGVLHEVATIFDTNNDGKSTIGIDEALLERMTGMPHGLLVATVEELRSKDLVFLEKDTIRWKP